MRKPRFIGSVKCHEVKAFDGSILTKDDTIMWLGESEGYAAAAHHRNSAKRFSSEEDVRKFAARASGSPWYYQFKHGSLVIEDVTNEMAEFSKSELILENLALVEVLKELRDYASANILSGGAHHDPVWAKVAGKLEQYGKNWS